MYVCIYVCSVCALSGDINRPGSALLPPQAGIWCVSDPWMWCVLMGQRWVNAKHAKNTLLCCPCVVYIVCEQVLAWQCRGMMITNVVSSSATFLRVHKSSFAAFSIFILTILHLHRRPLQGGWGQRVNGEENKLWLQHYYYYYYSPP